MPKSRSPSFKAGPARGVAALLTSSLCLFLALACEPGAGGAGAESDVPRPPYQTEAMTVALTESPANEVLANFYCRDFVSEFLCDNVLFDDPPPKKETLKFGFETVFKLGNPNKFSVPMVELLLALDVFEGEKQAELATLCVSFCDPAAEDCSPAVPEDACKDPGKDLNEVDELSDLVPSIDDLVGLAKDAVNGDLEENLKFRVIPAREFLRCRPVGTDCEPCGASAETGDPADETDAGASQTAAPQTICCGDEPEVTLKSTCHLAENEQGQSCELCDGEAESHIRFDLGVDAITSILSEVAKSSVDAISEGEYPSFDIPYTVKGRLLFDVPVLGRFALSFGPYSSTWSLD